MIWQGEADVRQASQIGVTYGGDIKPDPPKDATFIAANNVAQREYQKEYMEYWNSTAELTGTGKPVDIVIAPVCVCSHITHPAIQHLTCLFVYLPQPANVSDH